MVILAAAGGFAVSCVLGWGLVVAGLRAGDHPGDAAVAAVLVPGPRPVIAAAVRNPGDVPLLAGLTVRRQRLPGWLDAGHTVRVPRRTARRKFLPGAQDTVGVVPAGGQAQFRVAASGGGLAARRRYRLTAVVGQAGGRLRVIGVPVVSRGPAGAGRPAPAARAWDRD
jgi:hypothetical protein